MSRHLPNPVGCAIGFAAIGCGVGSVVGMGVGPYFWPPLPDGVGTNHDKVMAAYGGLMRGIVVGMAVGFVAGIAYAMLVRKWRTGSFA